MKKLMQMLFLFLIPLSTLNALELGDIKLESYLNEPLKASFTLGHIDSDHVADVLISLADQDSYKSFGITKPLILNQAKFKISADSKNRYLVNVSTQKRIKDPILDLLVKVTEKQGSVTRLYTLILDPRDVFISSQPSSKQIASSKTLSSKDATPSKTAQTLNPQVSENSSPNRIKVENDSLSMLAQNSAFHEKYSVYQIMRAFYLLNEEAFIQGNINRLIAGTSLIVPDEEMIAEVSRQKSINFVYSASKDNPFGQAESSPGRVVTNTSPKVEESTAPDFTDSRPQSAAAIEQAPLSVITDQSEAEPAQNVAQETVNMVVTTSAVNQIADADAKELSNLQQTIIAQQQSEIEQLKLTLSNKLDEIETINIRLNALELENSKPEPIASLSDSAIPPPPVIQVEAVREVSFLESYGNTITMTLALIILLLLFNREIVWRRRLKELEAYLVEPQKKGSNNEPAYEAVDSVTAKTTPKTDSLSKETPLEAGKYQDNLNDTFAQTIVEEIHYKPVKLDKPDKAGKSAKAIKSTDEDKPIVEEIDEDIELDFNLEFADDEPVSAENTLEIDEESLETLNLKLADEKFQTAVSAAKNYQSDDSDTLDASSDESKDPQILFSEIDVLIAYELYEEAHELIKKSRHDYAANKGCLDIRELEILAYLKNADLFFPMFEELKDSLPTEHPVEWEKIVSLSKEMSPPGPKLKAVF